MRTGASWCAGFKNPKGEVTIGVVGKYVSLTDAYKSLNEALAHGGVAHNLRVRLNWIRSRGPRAGLALRPSKEWTEFSFPGASARAERKEWRRRPDGRAGTGVPYFGICYGFQWAVVEYARAVCGLSQASSTECHPDSPHKVILKLRELLGVEEMGGTMRLGAYDCVIEDGLPRSPGLWKDEDLRAASPPLRVQPGVRAHPLRSTGFVSPVGPPTASSSRSRRSPTIPGSSRSSSIRSSSRARSPRTRCSASSSAPRGGSKNGELPEAAVGRPRARNLPSRVAVELEPLKLPRASAILIHANRIRGRWRRPLRRRTPLRSHRRSLHHRERRAPVLHGGADSRYRGLARRSLRVQGIVRQGEPDFDRRVPRPGPREGPRHPARGPGALRRPRDSPTSTSPTRRKRRRNRWTFCRFPRFSAARPIFFSPAPAPASR